MALNLATINVHHIGDSLKRKEGYAYGQRKVELGYEFLADRTIDVIGKKALVLVEAKYPQVENKVENEKEFSLPPPPRSFWNKEAESPIEHYGEDHEPDVDRFTPGVEEEREDQEYDVL